MGIVNLYLEKVLIPLRFAEETLGFEAGRTGEILFTVVVSLLLLAIVTSLLRGVWTKVRRIVRRQRSDEQSDYESLVLARMQARQQEGTDYAGPPAPATGLDALIKARQYDRVGEAYSEMGRPKEAAKWFKKAGLHRRSALELGRAGKKLRAAKILLKEGDFDGAGKLYEEKRKFAKAADAYVRAGKPADAARAYAGAGRIDQAMLAYNDYFTRGRDAVEVQLAAAQDCLKLLESNAGRAKVVGPARTEILKHLATRFETAKWYELAGKLFLDAGEPVRAGEDFVLAGRLQDAAACMKAAGRTREANQILGRFHETKNQWAEAAAAYAAADDFVRAAECFSKAADAVRAGEYFERASEFYRAGLAYARGARFQEAIRALQKVKESDPTFNQSRAMLGKCFYELHDYAHAAATLENHLTGRRVESGNIDYFYMLALAYEQMGKLSESRDILYKIQTVDMGFRDVTERLSNIASRISMQMSGQVAGGTPGATYHGTGAEATQVMQVVENALDGRYHLERELGRGGMGVVYLAKDAQLERSVALKFLGSLIDGSDEYRQRFIREARAAARISHPNIISIYDISATAGKAYIAMEFVDGPSLAKYLRQKGALAPREAVNIVAQACSALAAIHSAGIVHRDIKPDNILLGKGMLVKLTDFGLAKAEDARLTRAGTVMGTPSYMSPEQVMGKETDARSDIYSLGLVLHETLTGRTVFREGDVMERQVTELPPPPGADVDGIPPALDEAVMRCIAKEPRERYQKAAELYADLRKALT